MAQLEKNVRSIEKDGLLWGASKLVPIGYGIRKLQINIVIEDDKVGLDGKLNILLIEVVATNNDRFARANCGR